MKQPAIPANEKERLEALYKYKILDTPAEKYFDQLTELAAYVCNTPVATITFIDEDREWYKSRIGISDTEASRDISFCAHTILAKDLFIIPDTYKDKRFADNQFVLEEPPIRFYAGAPLITTNGYALGTICVIDHIPRELTADQKYALKEIAKQIMLQLEVREKRQLLDSKIRTTGKVIKKELQEIKKSYEDLSRELNRRIVSEIELKTGHNRLAQALESAQTGTWDWDLLSNRIIWNKMHEELFGFKPGTFKGDYKEFEKRIYSDDRVKVQDAMDFSINGKKPYFCEFRIIWPDKSIHWIRGSGQFLFDKQGRPVRMYGVDTDITVEKEAQFKLDRSIRALRVLGLCNAALTNIHDESRLLDEICRLMIEQGGYYFSWIGYPQQDEHKTVRPMAYAGHEAGYLENLVSWDKKNARGRGPVGKAIRSGKPIVVKDISNNREFRPWRKSALERGYASVAVLPLKMNKEILGNLNIYSREHDAFDTGEIKFLSELADNLARGIHSLRMQESLEETRMIAEQQFKELEILYDTAPMGYALMDKSCRYLKVNKALAKMNGLPVEDHINRSVDEIVPGIAPVIKPAIKQVFKTGKPVSGVELHAWSPVMQSEMHWLSQYYPLFMPDGKIHAVNSIIHDITEHKNFEETLNNKTLQAEFIGELGKAALTGKNVSGLLDWVVTELAGILSVDYVKILELQPLAKKLLLKAGCGWNDGLVGVATVANDIYTQAGYTLNSRKPVVVQNLETEKRFKGPKFLLDHNITSGISVAIGDVNNPYGILGVHTRTKREFNEQDINFVQSVANIITDAIQRDHSEKILLLEKNIQKYISSDLSLEKIMSAIIRDIEREFSGMRCGIFFYEPKDHDILHDIAPAFRNHFLKQTRGLFVNLFMKSHGTGIYRNEKIIAEDIYKDPSWKDYRDIAETNHIRACWSMPIVFSSGKIIASMAIFHSTPKSPSVFELKTIDRMKWLLDITIEQIITRWKFREINKYNTLLLSAAGEGIYGLDRNGNLTFMNPAASKILGWHEREILGKKMHNIIHHTRADGKRHFMKDCPVYASIEKGESHQCNVEFFWKKDGKSFPVEYVSTPVRNDQGKITGAVVVFHDISLRKKMEAETNRLIQRNSALVSALAEIVYESKSEANTISWEGNYTGILGYTEMEIGHTTESWTNRIHPDDRKKALKEVEIAARDKRIYDLQYRFLHKNGNYIWMHDRGVLVLDSDGNVESILGVFRDINRHKQAEKIIQESEEKYRAMYHDNPNMCFTTDEKGAILSVNKTGAGHLGYTAEELIGKPVTIIFPESEHAMVRKNLHYCIKLDGGMHEWEITKICKSGEIIWVKESARAIKSHGDTMILIVCNDITRNKENESEILESRERLRKLAEKLNVIREDERSMISREIHDELGQTLTGLRIDLAWLLDEINAKQLPFADRTRNALILADETLETVRRISHDLRPAMLDDLGLEAAIEWQMEEFSRRSGCQYDLVLNAGDIGLIQNRDTIVFRILQEALTNITRHAKASNVNVSLEKQNHDLVMFIADNGVGISDDALTSNNSIGLIGMRERAESIGGNINISRMHDGGTRLVLSIPADSLYDR